MEEFPEQDGSFENREKTAEVFVEREFERFVPEEFKDDPFAYFEDFGVNIKSGEPKYDETGRLRDDPTAVKEFPAWRDEEGNELRAVGKRVNMEKGETARTGNPFYEYEVMETVRETGLPAPAPIAKAEKEGNYLFVMERVPGVGWYEREEEHFKERGYSAEDIERLKQEAQQKMNELRERFEEAGVIRKWKPQDMVFDIDDESKSIRSVTPVDWERTWILKKGD